jgi:hypothetical protein
MRDTHRQEVLRPDQEGDPMVSNYSSRTNRLVGLTMLTASLAVAGCGSGGLSADAGEDFSVNRGEAPEFDGCGSEGDNLSFRWTIVEAPADMADDVGKVIRSSIQDCTFTLESDMEVADVGVWVIEMTVTDGETIETDQVTVTVS